MTELSDRLNIGELSIAERLQLVEEVWASIAAEQESLAISEAQREELERRIESYGSSRERGVTWESIRDRLAKK
jgi:putative addiction module component (TIGR02574 family)